MAPFPRGDPRQSGASGTSGARDVSSFAPKTMVPLLQIRGPSAFETNQTAPTLLRSDFVQQIPRGLNSWPRRQLPRI